MKHFTQTTANGLCTPPCGSSQSKSTRFSLFTSLLLFFLLFVGSNAAWAECAFTQNETIYLNCASSNWDEASATFKTIFYNSSNEQLNESWMSSTGTAHVFSLQIPVANAVKIKIQRWSSDKGGYWGTEIELSASTAETNDCVYCTAYAVGEWRTQGSGSITTGCDEEPTECSFAKNETIYLNCASSNWDEASATFKAKFYNSNNDKLNESWMSSTGTAHVFSLQIPVANAVKIKIERWSSDKGGYWGTNIELTAATAGTNDCVYCTAYAVGEWRTQGSGSITTNCGGDPEPAEREISDNYHMRGDLWVKDNDGHWAGTSNRDLCPKPYRETDGTYTFSYIAPVANKNRFAVQDKAGSCGEGYAASKQTGSSNDVSTNSEKYIFNVSSPKQVDVTFYPNDGNKCKVLLSDYTPVTTGWYFKCESAIGGVAANANTAMASDGTLTLTNVAAGTYYFYIHNNASEKYWGFNKFGGCYVDQTNSTASLISEKTADTKFDQKQWPIKSVSDRKVKMVVSGSDAGKNVRISFDGGKIVLTAYVPATTITYTGKEYVFLSKMQNANSSTFDFTTANAHLFVYFWNAETSAEGWSDEAFMWDSGDNVLAAKVPAGTWTNCKIVRKDACCNGKDWNNVWNQTVDLAVEPGKNYLQTGESSVWDVYTPPFYLTGSSVLCGVDWGYAGNGTTYNGSATRTNIPTGTYQFKLNPTKNYNGWEHQINYTHVASTGSNVTLSQHGDKNIEFTLSEASDVTIAYDGYGVTVNATPYAPPAVTRTVTIHPNNGESTFTMNVADGGTISSIAASYGNGTASWYKDEELTQAFTLNSSTVTEDMDLFAKWGVSGNFYLVGDFGMHDKGSNWAYNSGLAMTTTDGVASVTYIAPEGRHRFEILTGRSSWPAIANQGSELIAASTPTLSWSNEGAGGYHHFRFDLGAPKKVTVRYDGKVSVTAEDYVVAKTGWTVASKSLFGHGTEESPDNADDGTYMNGYNMTEGQMNSDGELVIHNLDAGTYKFWIGKYNTALNKQKQNVEVFGAAHVDKANSSLGDYGSLANVSDDTYNRSIPMDDKLHRRVTFTLNQRASIKIAFDGGKITVNLQPKHTVSFNSNGGSEVASQSVFEGAYASEPDPAPTKSGYSSVKWQLSGADYNFNTPVTTDITLDAVWAYKAIESVSLNESAHATWIGNDDFILTPTLTPSDLIAKSVAWTSDAEGVATVSNGTVHAVSAGTATITCTVTDMFDTQRSATCEVTVAACQMTTDDLYSMTVTGYNMHDGDDADLGGLWNESSDNTEPASMTITRLAFHKKDAGNTLYAYDDNGTVKVKEDASGNDVQWILIPVGENYTPSWNGGNACQLYYIKNVSTGKFMHRGTQGQDGSGFNVQWWYSVTNTNATNAATDDYKWFFVNENDNQRGVYVKSGVGDSKPNSYKLHSSNEFNNCTDTYAPKPMLPVGRTADMNDYAKSYKNTNDFNYDTYSNPNYKASQMNSAYYRMKADATVRANLENALVYGSVITVRLYADAATTVQLTKADGTEIETINLSADAAHEYTYTVAYGSELVGATAFIIKAADNHAGIASIKVSRTHAASPADPALTWDVVDLKTTGITQSALAGTFQHVASSALSDGAVHYVSSNPAVATVAANGTVTPIKAGSTTITATIEAEGCYNEASNTYNITLTEPTLAELIAADAGEGITLTHDYAEDVVINKAITIDGNNHAIGNLKVENEGDLTLSSALTVADFTICAKAGNTTTPAASGQVRNATNLTVNGEAYFLYTVDPSGKVHFGWYDFTVPFRVNVMTGIAGIENEVLNEDFVNERNYAIMEHLGEKQAAGQYAYKKFRGIMEPCRLYSITLDDDYNYNTIRFKKADGALVASDEVTLNTYASTVDDKHANWNGVGNGTLHHADAGLSVPTIQVYQSGNKTFLPVDRAQYSLVIGSAFMVQQAGTMTLNQATHNKLLAPRRDASAQATAIQIAREGKPFSDQLFISADETAGQGYTQGVDVAKAGNIGNVNVPQIWTNAYDSKLCAHEAQLINGQAAYALSLYAPANGTYTLTSKNIPEGYTLYLTQNGNKIWDMSDAYVIDLTKGTTNEYGLLLVERYNAPTGIENGEWTNGEAQKVLRNGVLYIIRNGEVYDAQGARVE